MGDEFRLFVHPVLIGGGKPLCPALHQPQGPAPAGGEPDVRERGRAAALPARL
ncbi:hypothetical protein [Streptomyces sp. NPDC059262]|uniref:hypothetical protein n=1 Tax=Streptomyces sp. NPDC059262 TaxID=3346797 RepID=UPI0036AB543B